MPGAGRRRCAMASMPISFRPNTLCASPYSADEELPAGVHRRDGLLAEHRRGHLVRAEHPAGTCCGVGPTLGSTSSAAARRSDGPGAGWRTTWWSPARCPTCAPTCSTLRVVVAPLRVARGIQNKILEAMAMGQPVVAAEGCAAPVDADAGQGLLRRTAPEDYIAADRADCSNRPSALRWSGSTTKGSWQRYSWDAHLTNIDRYLAPAVSCQRNAVMIAATAHCHQRIMATSCPCCSPSLPGYFVWYRDTGLAMVDDLGPLAIPSRTASWCRRSVSG